LAVLLAVVWAVGNAVVLAGESEVERAVGFAVVGSVV